MRLTQDGVSARALVILHLHTYIGLKEHGRLAMGVTVSETGEARCPIPLKSTL